MDELRQHISDLQNNQRALVASQNVMQKVINCNSEIMEKLKNYTIKMNDRVTALENILKLEKDQQKTYSLRNIVMKSKLLRRS